MHYNHFRVGPPTDNYRLSISGYTGITPDDPFTTHTLNGQSFSTYDRNNNVNNTRCAVRGHSSTAPGGWWYNSCFFVNLNYNHDGPYGFIYLANARYSPIYIEMKVRPKFSEIIVVVIVVRSLHTLVNYTSFQYNYNFVYNNIMYH